MAEYSIFIHPGETEGGVGGAANVYLTLLGTKASSQEFRIGRPPAGEPGSPVAHCADLTELGEIQRVRVRHDDTGVGVGCFLDRIVIRSADTRREWLAICRRWLARHQDDGATERTLDAHAVERG